MEAVAKTVEFDDAPSIIFDIHKTYGAAPAEDIVLRIFDKIKPMLSIRRQDNGLYLRNLKTVLVNLFVAQDIAPATWVAYNSGHDAFKAKSRYNKLGISRVVVPIVEAMQNAGLVERIVGFRDRNTGIGRLSRCRATSTLKGMFFEAALVRECVVREIESIVLRGPKNGRKKGDNLEYKDTKQTKSMRRVMDRINQALVNADVTIAISDEERKALVQRLGYEIDVTQTQLQRVFNEDFGKGGRLYRHWIQSLPKEFRPKLKINGNDTIELDYSELHTRLLYAKVSAPMPDGDVYELPMLDGRHTKAEWRKKCKLCMNSLLNSPTKEAGILAAMDSRGKPWLKTNKREMAWIADALISKHEPIAQFFGSGVGLRLQRLDSDLAVDVLTTLLDQEVLALPVHDSFVVEVQHGARLRKAMEDAFKIRFGVEAKIG